MSKEHLDLFTAMARLRVFGRGGNCAGDITGIPIQITRHLAHRHVRAAAKLQIAAITIPLTGTVAQTIADTLDCLLVELGPWNDGDRLRNLYQRRIGLGAR